MQNKPGRMVNLSGLIYCFRPLIKVHTFASDKEAG